MVSTGTASGKTLAFNLPVLNALAADPKHRALYLYPTKALAQDQARSLAAFRLPGLRAAIYDGDTEPERRWQIRKWANVILTNPDMLHVGVLPHHDRWGDVLQNLRYVVVDEAHVYRGVFGSHVGNVLRRLRRAAGIYGAEPQFLLASATIANPGEQAAALLGLDVTVVADDAAPRAERTVAFWNPPLLDEELGVRASPLGEAARILAELVGRDLRTICFAKSRRAAELVHRFASERLDKATAARLSPYRAATHRRSAARSSGGSSRVSSSASPRPTRSSWESISGSSIARSRSASRGRWRACASSGAAPGAARTGWPCSSPPRTRSTSSSCVSRRRYGRRVEAAILDHANPRILDGHVRSAAFEAPIDDGDTRTLGAEALERAEALAETGDLKRTKAGFVWAGRDYPAGRVPLRSTSPDAFAVVEADTGSVLGTSERERAFSTLHEGAIYLHLGESYRVLALDLDARAALVERFTSRLLHAGEEGVDDRHRGSRARAGGASGSTSSGAA